MKTIRYFLMLALLFVMGTSVFSQTDLNALMRSRGEYYFTLSVNDRAEIQTIGNMCSVDGTDGHTVVCYANQQQYDRLLQAGYRPVLQTPPSLLEEAVMWDGNRATYEWDSYPTYSQYQSMMEAYPASAVSGRTCTLLTLGTLSSGRKIMGVRINNGSPEGKPKFLYSSTIHGDETTGWILLLRLIDELCTSTDSRIVNLIDNLDIFIFPNTNPDGTYYGGNNTVTGARRANANGIDMNRNYPDPHSSAHPDGNAYQTETQWFMQLAEDYPFVMAANYHGGAEIVNYPWDNTSTRHADDAWWQYVSSEYANLAHAVNSSYLTTCNYNGDTPSGITNGADWYTIGGGRQDYMNGYRQCREFTVECSNTKNPSASQLPTFWNYNHNSMLAYMEQCLNGVHGVVYDATTDQPLDGVTVTVLNHDDEYSIVSTHEVGDFHRPIKGGTWTFKFTKEGYCNESVTVTVADGQREDVNVYLYPSGNCPVVMECYEQVTPTAAGSYVMGYLNGSTLVMPTHNNGTANTTSVDVTPTNSGFSVEEETLPGLYTLTAYGSNGQYYIKYNNRFLARSNSSLTWGTSQTTSSRWYINANGIYQTSSSGMGGSTSYYLYYSNGSFRLSTTQQNNITFYVAGDCPTTEFTITATANPVEGGIVEGAGTYQQDETCTLTATPAEGYTFVNWTEDGEEVSTETSYGFVVTTDRDLVANFEEAAITDELTVELVAGWNWWSTNVEITLAQLEEALGTNGVTIISQDGGAVTNSSYGWGGDPIIIEVGKMYKIQTSSACTLTLSGAIADPSMHPITLMHGANWIGFVGTEGMALDVALSNLTPTNLDNIKTATGSVTYYQGLGWRGNISSLEPGKGYVYKSNASEPVTFNFPTR